MSDRAGQYAASLDALTRRAFELPDDARKAVVDQLRQAAEAIGKDLAGADPGSYSSSRLQALKAEIERKLAQFAQAASSEVAKAQKTMAADATKSVSAVVSTGTKTLAVQPVVDTKMVTIAQGYSADLVTGLSRETATRINGALQRAALGGQTMQQLVAQIGGALDGGKFSGIFSETGERAETIATNEVLRMHSLASVASIKELVGRHGDGVQKEWMHTPAARIPRLAHIAANKQVRPVDKPFLVGLEELMYPRDPNGSAANTINCHCLVRPALSQALLKPSSEEQDVLARLGISVSTTRS